MFLKNCLILLLSCFMLLPSLAIADEPTLSFYEISGKNAWELRKQIDEKRPQDKTGKRFDALTKYQIAFTYRYAPTPSGCKIVAFSATLEITIIMPRWMDGDTTSNLGKKWQNYYQALYAHELGHRDIDLRLHREIEEAGRKFETNKECEAISGEFKLVSDSLFEKYNRINQQYDVETNHGMKQGASFPYTKKQLTTQSRGPPWKH